ncbi:type I-F CRISPR-associated endonuclease Cas1f [Sulfurimonas sp.]
MKKNYKNKSIQLSKRGFIFLIEHARIKVENGVLVYLQAENGVFKSYNIPHINTSLVMVGEGSSITRDAVAILSDSNTLLMFVGGRGSPLHASSDLVFNVISPAIEYAPTQYMQQWIQIFVKEDTRLLAAKDFMLLRIKNILYFYNKLDFIKETGVSFNKNSEDITLYKEKIENSKTTQDVLVAEAWFTKNLYAKFAKSIQMSGFTREHSKNSDANDFDIINGFLDHGNYLFYGLASVTLHGLGISYALPLLHGKTRRGALVFDVADLIKDSICLPLAFYCALEGKKDKDFRESLMNIIEKNSILDLLFLQVKSIALKDYNNV